MASITDVTAIAAAVLSAIAVVVSARSLKSATRSAATAERALVLSHGIAPRLTDSEGGPPRVTIAEDHLKLWLTNWGSSGLRIEQVDSIYYKPPPSRIWPLRNLASGRRDFGVGRVEKPVVDGGGPRQGANVAEIHIPIETDAIYHSWGFATQDTKDARVAIRDGYPHGDAAGIEIFVRSLRLGTIERYFVSIRGGRRGGFLIEDLTTASLLDHEPTPVFGSFPT